MHRVGSRERTQFVEHRHNRVENDRVASLINIRSPEHDVDTASSREGLVLRFLSDLWDRRGELQRRTSWEETHHHLSAARFHIVRTVKVREVHQNGHQNERATVAFVASDIYASRETRGEAQMLENHSVGGGRAENPGRPRLASHGLAQCTGKWQWKSFCEANSSVVRPKDVENALHSVVCTLQHCDVGKGPTLRDS